MLIFLSRLFIANIFILLSIALIFWSNNTFLMFVSLVASFLYCATVLFSTELKKDNVFFGDRSNYLHNLADYIYYFFQALFFWQIFKYIPSAILFLLSILATQLLFWLVSEFENIEKIIIFNKDTHNRRLKNLLNQQILIKKILASLYFSMSIFIFFNPALYKIVYPVFFTQFTIAIMLIVALLLKSWRLLRNDWWESLSHELNSHNYEVILFGSGPPGAAYQLNQWLDVLEKSDINTLVVVGERHFLTDLNQTRLPIAFYRSIPDLDLVIPASVRVVLYPAANAAKNTQLLRKENIKHIFINHGESDKSVNESKFLQAYDKLYLAGDIALNRLEKRKLNISEYALVGRPQLVGKLKISSESLTEKKKIRILYAPTWEGFFETSNYSSLIKSTIQAINQLLSDGRFIVLFKPHPYTGISNKTYLSTSKVIQSMVSQHSNGEDCSDMDIFDLMNRSDILLCDVSSVMNDYLYTCKPIVMSNPKNFDACMYHEEFPSSKAAYLVDQNMEQLTELLNNLVLNDSYREIRLRYRQLSLGERPENSLSIFKEQLLLDISSTSK